MTTARARFACSHSIIRPPLRHSDQAWRTSSCTLALSPWSNDTGRISGAGLKLHPPPDSCVTSVHSVIWGISRTIRLWKWVRYGGSELHTIATTGRAELPGGELLMPYLA